jgi:hypothetical protein
MPVSRYSTGNLPGPMGYLGLVKIQNISPLRVLSSSIAAKQAVQHPDVLDGRVDRTTYQLGPVEVDGDIAVPIVVAAGEGNILNELWPYVTERDVNGELFPPEGRQVYVQYSTGIRRTFNGCKPNTFEIRTTAGDRVESTINFMGTTLDEGGGSEKIVVSPARVLTWDQVSVDISGDQVRGETCQIKEFTCRINNNMSRNYTFCPGVGLFASNISTGKRHVEGTIGYQGWALTEDAAITNPLRQTANASIVVVIGIAPAAFTKTFKRVIFEYQAIEMNIGLLTSSVNWYAHADDALDAFE